MYKGLKILVGIFTFIVTFNVIVYSSKYIAKNHIELETRYSPMGRFIRIEPFSLLKQGDVCDVVTTHYGITDMTFSKWFKTPKYSVVYQKHNINKWYRISHQCNIKHCEFIEECWYPFCKELNTIK